MLYVGSILIFLWGIGHLFPTKSVVADFGELSGDNKKIITMEWIAEGLTLCFIGFLGMIIQFYFGSSGAALSLIIRVCAVMLLTLAGVSAFTGARTSVLPMKMCPYVKTFVAVLYFWSTV